MHCPWCNNPEGIDPAPAIMFDERLCHRFGECLKPDEKAVSLDKGNLLIKRDLISDASVYNNVCPSKALIVCGEEKTTRDLTRELEKDIPFFNMSGGGVTLTGGEPLAQGHELKELIIQLKKRDINVLVETSMHLAWDTVKEYSGLTDMFLADLKHIDNVKFERFTGGNLSLVLDNFKKLDKTGKAFIVRIPVIPGFNFSAVEIHAMIDFAAALKNASEINFIPFHTLAWEKYLMLGKGYSFGNLRNIDKTELIPFAEYAETKGMISKIMN